MTKKSRKYISFFLAVSVMFSVFSCSDKESKEHTESSAEVSTETSTEAPSETSTQAPTEEVTVQPVTYDSSKRLLKGNIYDSNGRLLMYTKVSEDGSLKRVSSESTAVPFANIITEMSAGYDLTFNDILSSRNPSPVDNNSNVGRSIQITVDSDVQNAVYDYMKEMNIVGSAVVMRTDGSILAQVSYPSYNPADVRNTKYDEKLAWGECGNKAFQNFEPGSCFKIMSEVICDKYGIYSLYDDGEWTDDGATIVNWDHETNKSYPIPDRSLYSAFVSSSNIFFAKAFSQIGEDKVMKDLDDYFHFITEIDCDFGEIHNNVEVYCNDDLRRTAFGQAYVLTCPIYLATLGREAVFGDMVKPFVLKNVVDTSDPDRVISAGTKSNEKIASIPVEYRQNLLDAMQGVANGLGIYLPDGYTLYAKTGTAETWVGDFLYITGCVKNDYDDGEGTYSNYDTYGSNGSYIIVMQVQNPKEHELEFASQSAHFYQGIINAVFQNQ